MKPIGKEGNEREEELSENPQLKRKMEAKKMYMAILKERNDLNT